MIKETDVLKSAIEYLQAKLPGIRIVPFSQQFEEPGFPTVAVNVHSRSSQLSIHGEELALVTISVSVYADNLYDTAQKNGVMGIYDKIIEAFVERGYQRVNQTEPYYTSSYRKWCKDGNFNKKTNVF